jgi:K+-sensing histidine kinase KdpD
MARTEITDFWSTVVFELRQPMTAVSGQAQRAQQLLETDPARAHEAMDQVVEQIARMDRLLEALRVRVSGHEPRPANAWGNLPAPQEERHAKDLSDTGSDRAAPLRR